MKTLKLLWSPLYNLSCLYNYAQCLKLFKNTLFFCFFRVFLLWFTVRQVRYNYFWKFIWKRCRYLWVSFNLLSTHLPIAANLCVLQNYCVQSFGKLVCVFSCTGHFIKMDSVTVAVLQFSWNFKKNCGLYFIYESMSLWYNC